MDYETILYEVSPDDRVVTLTINRPDSMNSFNQKMLDEFRDAWHRINYDDDLNAVVLRAAPAEPSVRVSTSSRATAMRPRRFRGYAVTLANGSGRSRTRSGSR